MVKVKSKNKAALKFKQSPLISESLDEPELDLNSQNNNNDNNNNKHFLTDDDGFTLVVDKRTKAKMKEAFRANSTSTSSKNEDIEMEISSVGSEKQRKESNPLHRLRNVIEPKMLSRKKSRKIRKQIRLNEMLQNSLPRDKQSQPLQASSTIDLCNPLSNRMNSEKIQFRAIKPQKPVSSSENKFSTKKVSALDIAKSLQQHLGQF